MAPTEYTRIVLNERPLANIDSKTFRKEVIPFNLNPGKDEVLVQVIYLSLDPAMRGWINDKRSYMEPVKIGETMRSSGLGVVAKTSPGSKLVEGDVVSGLVGWTEYAVVPEKGLHKIVVPEGAEVLDFLGPLGMTGLTAYFGLFDVAKVKPGQTLVVTGAAGATGSIVCQLGKIAGAKVFAVAGGPEKCEWLEKELGVDKALDYKSPTFHDDFKKSVGYLDAMFDNVGGDILDFALTRLNKNAKIALCGAISDYNSKPKGLTGYLNLISQTASIQGFLVFDFAAKFPTAIQELTKWLTEGKIKRKFHVVEGLEKAPETLPLLFSGGNTGKLVIKVAELPRKDSKL
ncbi:alcohol dehydrogenase [Abortiporus biennis]|nr:alcohol dehydrogenase [Abortiporus biennis]